MRGSRGRGGGIRWTADRPVGSEDVTAERTYVQDHVEDLHADLDQWLRIPSISADPARADDIRRSADWLAAAFRRTGFPTVEVWEAGGAPAVFAEWPAGDPAAPTVVVYGHHDVQPVDPQELWRTPPFEPTRRGEGEEESGSPHFADLLRSRRDRLDCDVVVVTDTGMFDQDTPSSCTGMRGLVSCQVDFHGPDVDLHSGLFGGAVPNPLTALARVIGALHDEEGRVQVPGFYDDVVALTPAERAAFGRLPFDEAQWLGDTAASRATAGEARYSTLERIWARPTAEVNGLWGGYTGPGGKTIIPTDAHAKLSFRLVAGQQPKAVQDGVRRFVAARTPPGIVAEVTFESDG